MDPIARIAVQLGLIIVPLVTFIIAKKAITTIPMQLVAGMILALFAGALAFYFSAERGWQPMSRSGRSPTFSPTTLLAIFTGVMMFTFALLIFKRAKEPNGRGPN